MEDYWRALIGFDVALHATRSGLDFLINKCMNLSDRSQWLIFVGCRILLDGIFYDFSLLQWHKALLYWILRAVQIGLTFILFRYPDPIWLNFILAVILGILIELCVFDFVSVDVCRLRIVTHQALVYITIIITDSSEYESTIGWFHDYKTGYNVKSMLLKSTQELYIIYLFSGLIRLLILRILEYFG